MMLDRKGINHILATIYPDWIQATIRTVNAVRGTVWSQVQQQDIPEQYQLLSYDRPFRDFPLPVGCEPVLESFRALNNLVQSEYVLFHPGEIVYEPRYGWAMTKTGQLIVDSLPYTYYALLPSLVDYLKVKILPINTVRAGKVASFRDVGDKNYYHFYNDHLVKLALLEKAGLPERTPLLVSKVLFDRPYFQEALARTGLGKRCWIVQDREYVAAEGSYFLKTMPITREYLQYVLKMLGAPKPDPNKGRRIFIDRGENVGRCITNIAEVREVLASFDFEAVTLDGMSLGDQMTLFSEAGFIVGIHGAGLANIIFRAGENMKVLEIFPPNNIPAMFYWISCTFGFDYDALVGEKSKWQRAERQQWAKVDFYIDPEALKGAVNKMLRKK